MSSMIASHRFAFPAFKIFFIVAIFVIAVFSAVPQLAYAGPTGGGGCSGTTWEYTYTMVTNPFPPGSAGDAAFRAVYGGDSYTVQSTYQVATVADIDEGCIEEPTTPYVGIIATPSSISSGGSSLLTWTSDYVTSCTGTNFSTGGATAGSLIVSPASSITYSITCTDGSQTVSSSATVTVSAPVVAPTATLSANPTSLVVGISSVITWSSTNATSCTGTNFSTGGATLGSVTVSPTQTTSYLVSCSGAGGSASASQTVTVTALLSPTVSLSVTPGTLSSGSSATLTWSSTNAVSCVGSGFETGGNTSGSISTGALSADTNYSITCTGVSVLASSGTWQYSESDVSDFSCPLTDPNKAYSSIPSCPSSPTGKACSIPVCKVNTISACNINTDVYTCVGSSPAVTPQSAFATTNVQVNSSSSALSGSCSVSPTSVYTGSPATWTAVATGGTGSYTYSWSGTDSLSGVVASIAKTYTTTGTKTASVTITSPSGVTSVALQGEKQCSGGTKVGSYGSIEDGVGFTGGSNSTLAAVCADITPASGCCAVDVQEIVNSTGQPVNTYYRYDAYSGASLISKNSTSVTLGGNTTRHNYFGGLATASAPTSVTASCSNSVAVSAVLSDLTVGSVSPNSAVLGTAKTFSATVTNTGNPATGGGFTNLFQRATSAGGANTTDIGTDTSPNVSANGSDVTTFSYTFPSVGTWYLRACADKSSASNPGGVNESNENNNCGAWTAITVSNPSLSASCNVSPSSGYVGDSLTWTVTPSGGVGSYTYVWSGTDGLSGTGATVSKTYAVAGTKSASVIVTSGTGSVTAACTNGIIQNTPTVLITVSPSVIVKGVTSPRIDWTSSYTTSCTGTNFPTGSATVGSVTVSPAVTTTYGITCTNGTRSASSSATVTVNPADITLAISPAVTVRQGDPATVSWGVVGTPDSCSISGPGLSSTAFSGAQSVIINQESTYTMTCLTGGIISTKSVTIGVTPRFDEF